MYTKLTHANPDKIIGQVDVVCHCECNCMHVCTPLRRLTISLSPFVDENVLSTGKDNPS